MLTRRRMPRGQDPITEFRDWNEELQSILDIPDMTNANSKDVLNDRIIREKCINRFWAEFTQAAVKGAQAAVRGELTPLPTDPPEHADPTPLPRSQLFMQNGIFYSIGYDQGSIMDTLGGTAAWHASSGKDILGIRNTNEIIQNLNNQYLSREDTENGADEINPCFLRTVVTVAVDYCGRRVICQAIVPGILRANAMKLAYGSADDGKTVRRSSHWITETEQLGKAMLLAPHIVTDAEGQEFNLSFSRDVKGIDGTDGRKYLLEMFRVWPVDKFWIDEECNTGESSLPPYLHQIALIRPELIQSYYASRLFAWSNAKSQELLDKAKQQADSGNEQPQDAVSQPEKLFVNLNDFKWAYNPDAFTPADRKEDVQSNDAVHVLDLGRHLRETVIPLFVRELKNYQVTPVDGKSLTEAMHANGINMRYLGKILILLEKDSTSSHTFPQVCFSNDFRT